MQPPIINNSTEKFWSFTTADAFKHVSSTDKGLSSKQSKNRLKKYGINTFKA
jgi:hypothetical protein